jgi:hypothetical protein
MNLRQIWVTNDVHKKVKKDAADKEMSISNYLDELILGNNNKGKGRKGFESFF